MARAHEEVRILDSTKFLEHCCDCQAGLVRKVVILEIHLSTSYCDEMLLLHVLLHTEHMDIYL